MSLDQFRDRGGSDVEDLGADVNGTVDRSQVPGRRDCLGQPAATVFFGKKRLALQVAFLDEIAICYRDAADPRPHQYFGNYGSECSAPDQEYPAAEDPRLAGGSDTAEENLS